MKIGKLSAIEKDFIWSLATNSKHNLINNFNMLEDKNKIFSYCNLNNIELFLYNFLEKNVSDMNNKDTYLALKSQVDGKKIKTLMNISAGIKLCKEFSRNNINYVALKGLSYIDKINVDERLFRDLDILVDIKDIEKSVQIAQKNGFIFKNNKRFTRDLITKRLDKYCLPQMYDSNNVVLEIHYRIEANELIQCKLAAKMLAEKKLTTAYGQQFYAPTNEYKFIHLAYHAISKGNFDVGISSIFDLFIFKDKGMIDPIKINKLKNNFSFDADIEIFNFILRDDEKKIISLEGRKHLNYIKELFLQPIVNKRITGFHLANGFFEKALYLKKFLFVHKEILKRDFNFNNPLILYLLTPLRWLRQLSLRSFSLGGFMLNYRNESKRAKTILCLKNKDIYRKMK